MHIEEVFHAGRFKLSCSLLRALLQLPPEWKVRAIQTGDFGRSLDFYVEGPGLPVVREGYDVPDLPSVDLLVHSMEDGDGNRWYRYEVQHGN